MKLASVCFYHSQFNRNLQLKFIIPFLIKNRSIRFFFYEDQLSGKKSKFGLYVFKISWNMRTLLFNFRKLILNALLGIRSSFIRIKMFDVCFSVYWADCDVMWSWVMWIKCEWLSYILELYEIHDQVTQETHSHCHLFLNFMQLWNIRRSFTLHSFLKFMHLWSTILFTLRWNLSSIIVNTFIFLSPAGFIPFVFLSYWI